MVRKAINIKGKVTEKIIYRDTEEDNKEENLRTIMKVSWKLPAFFTSTTVIFKFPSIQTHFYSLQIAISSQFITNF